MPDQNTTTTARRSARPACRDRLPPSTRGRVKSGMRQPIRCLSCTSVMAVLTSSLCGPGKLWAHQYPGDLILMRLFVEPQGAQELGHRLDTEQGMLVPHLVIIQGRIGHK